MCLSLFCERGRENNCRLFFAAGRRDVYLVFKLLNASQTGRLSEEEFASIYDVISLKWKVINYLMFFPFLGSTP